MTDDAKPDPLSQLDLMKGIGTLETLLRLPNRFLSDLLTKDDDWAFVVKLHALLETAVTMLLLAHFGKPELEGVIGEEMEMSQRIKMLKAMNLCSSEQREVMRKLGKLRNQCVHSAQGTQFSLSDYLSDKGTRLEFWKAFGIGWAATAKDKIASQEASWGELAPLAPRLAIWADVLGILFETANATDRRRLQEAQADIDRRALQALAELMDVSAGSGRGTPLPLRQAITNKNEEGPEVGG